MPGFDGTGPMGRGSMTGGGFGDCAPGAVNSGGSPIGLGRGGAPRGGGRGLGWGGGRGGGQGRGNRGFRFMGSQAQESGETQSLKDHAKALESELEVLRRRISELESKEEN